MPLNLLETQIIVKLTEGDNLVKVAVVDKVETTVEQLVVAAVKVVVIGGTEETEDRMAVKVEMAAGLLLLERPTQ